MAGDDIRNHFAPPNSTAVAADPTATLTQDEAWAAVVGPSNTQVYVERFRSLALGGSAPWHWPAFLVTWFWLMYRKMWIGALVYTFAPGIVLVGLILVFRQFAPVAVIAWFLALLLLPAVMANRWYFNHCTAKIRNVRARGGSKEQMLARLASAGGTSRVIVGIAAVVVLGMVSAVAVPAYQTYTLMPKVAEALQTGYDVALAVGQKYERTKAFPSDSEVAAMLASASHQSNTVRRIAIDHASGRLTLDVAPSPAVNGTIHLVPTLEDGHLYWACDTEDLKPYVPRTCRGSTSVAR